MLSCLILQVFYNSILQTCSNRHETSKTWNGAQPVLLKAQTHNLGALSTSWHSNLNKALEKHLMHALWRQGTKMAHHCDCACVCDYRCLSVLCVVHYDNCFLWVGCSCTAPSVPSMHVSLCNCQWVWAEVIKVLACVAVSVLFVHMLPCMLVGLSDCQCGWNY